MHGPAKTTRENRMQATDVIRAALEQSFHWNKMLAEDLRDASLVFPTANGGNHARWVVGHAATAHSALRSFITGEPNRLSHWDEILGGGTTPTDDPKTYPPYSELLETWCQQYEQTLSLLDTHDDAMLDQSPQALPEKFRDEPSFQTAGRLFLFIAMDEMSHRGQLADVRRSIGRPILAF